MDQRELGQQTEQRHSLSKSIFKRFLQNIFPKFINSAQLSVPDQPRRSTSSFMIQFVCLWPNGLGMEIFFVVWLIVIPFCGHSICLGHGITQSIKYSLSNQTNNGKIRLGPYCILYYMPQSLWAIEIMNVLLLLWSLERDLLGQKRGRHTGRRKYILMALDN